LHWTGKVDKDRWDGHWEEVCCRCGDIFVGAHAESCGEFIPKTTPDKAQIGGTDEELASLVRVVNAIGGDPRLTPNMNKTFKAVFAFLHELTVRRALAGEKHD
jgi:hypothetical protein